MSGKLLELRCDKNLIDSTFEGYKLSLNEVPATVKDLPVGVNKLECLQESFSYLSVALHSMHNHLITDPWRKTLFYFIDKRLRIIEVSVNPKNNSVEDLRVVLQIPSMPECLVYNASIVFSDSDVALVADGLGLLYVVNTGDRGSCQNWTIEYSGRILEPTIPFIILDGRSLVKENSTTIHCLLTAIEEQPEEASAAISRAQTALFLVELKKNDDEWESFEPFKITTDGLVRYGYFQPECKCLFLESTKPLKLPNDEEVIPQVTKKDPLYFWQQSADEIKIWCAVPKNCAKEDIKIDTNGNQLTIAFNSENFLCGEPFQRLDSELTTWTVAENRLEVVVCKQQEGQMWQYLVQNDDRGEEVMDPELVGQIHERLAHLCSENEALADDTTPTFNPGQLEACDNIPEEDSRLYVIDVETKTVTKEINLSGHQKLFNIRKEPTEAPFLCIRHDVDGILWKLNYENTNVCEHVGTLNAFGYVLASKQWKYSTCSPDLSYAVIAATKQNLFVYKQNCHVDSELRNRKTNQKFSKVGKQYLISLNTTDEILGLRATNEFIFVLTKSCIHLFDMKDVQ